MEAGSFGYIYWMKSGRSINSMISEKIIMKTRQEQEDLAECGTTPEKHCAKNKHPQLDCGSAQLISVGNN